ncbi:hypothetical protein ACH4UR_05785 [Streptomyces lydicus]|uniref:hypothetical protein n=1 Tax=Streptomyces lydicus TaxID=47763 RepID=UPI0033C81556
MLMDAAVIALAFLLTRPWGGGTSHALRAWGRVPSWLLALPMWCATGLLAPISPLLGSARTGGAPTVFPAQTLAAAVRGSPPGAGGGSLDALLAPWVRSLVYTGFIVQALALGTLFVLYARERWAPLWRGRIGTLPDSPTRSARRLTAAAVAVLSLLPATTHLLWASGSTTGPNAARAAATDLDSRLNNAGYVLFALLTAVGALTLGYGRSHRVPLLLPLAATWIGSGALAGWGGWLTLTTLSVSAGDPKLPSPLLSLTYAVQMIVGMLVAVAGAHFFAEREAARCA